MLSVLNINGKLGKKTKLRENWSKFYVKVQRSIKSPKLTFQSFELCCICFSRSKCFFYWSGETVSIWLICIVCFDTIVYVHLLFVKRFSSQFSLKSILKAQFYHLQPLQMIKTVLLEPLWARLSSKLKLYIRLLWNA